MMALGLVVVIYALLAIDEPPRAWWRRWRP